MARFAGLSWKLPEGFEAAAAWQRLGPDYLSPFQALSYRPNLEGWRGTLRWRGRRAGMGLFAKRLVRVAAREGDPESVETLSALVSWRPLEPLLLDLSATQLREEYEADCRCERPQITLAGRWRVGRAAELLFELNLLEAGDAVGRILSVQTTAEF